jgi:hypothetical protein
MNWKLASPLYSSFRTHISIQTVGIGLKVAGIIQHELNRDDDADQREWIKCWVFATLPGAKSSENP